MKSNTVHFLGSNAILNTTDISLKVIVGAKLNKE